MRFWSPLTQSDSRKVQRKRSVLNPPSGQAKFGARPMFSRPDEEPEPDSFPPSLAPEAKLDDLVPTDRRLSSQSEATERKPVNRGVILDFSIANVSSPPTETELNDAFGRRLVGYQAIVIDGGGLGQVWLVVKSKGDSWWYESLTKAV